jgi:hypothetical protein
MKEHHGTNDWRSTQVVVRPPRRHAGPTRRRLTTLTLWLVALSVLAAQAARSTVYAGDYTLFGTTTPGNPDSNDDTGSSVELGVRFYSDVAATVTGIRFYKSALNTGTHIGHLWTDAGTLLGTVTFNGETTSGWQTASFDTPITIAANTVYLADYFNPNGHYAGDVNAFTTQFDNAPLHAVASGTGGNGRYVYTDIPPAFPTATYNAGNYWVDVILNIAEGTTTTSTTASTTSTSTTSTTTPTTTTMTTSTTTLPSCDESDYTDEQVDAAVQQAQSELGAQGIVVNDINDPYFVVFMSQMADDLGCSLSTVPSASGAQIAGAQAQPQALSGSSTCDQLYTSYDASVGYCGPGDTRSNPGLPRVDDDINRACWAHDDCYCNHCITSSCYLTSRGEARDCDGALQKACSANKALPHGAPPLTGEPARMVCGAVSGFIAGGGNRGPQCDLNATTCSGDCQKSVCVQGKCIAATDSSGNSLLGSTQPVAAKVTTDSLTCNMDRCGQVGGCVAVDLEGVNYYTCNGVTGTGLYCGGGGDEGLFTNCGHTCGEFACGQVYVLDAWQEVTSCAQANSLPVVPGPLPKGTVMWFGSQAQLQGCLGCVAP